MKTNIYVYIFVMFAVTYLIRVLPLTLIRKPIKNRFIRSFLFYVPYVTLAVMTFPDIIQATTLPVAGLLALVWLPHLRVPSVVARGAGVLAGASLWIYLTHWQVYPRWEETHPWFALVTSLGVGVACAGIAGRLGRLRSR